MTLLRGDCFSQLLTLESGSVDACVTDPPYGIHMMGHDWDRASLLNRAERWPGKSVAEILKVVPKTAAKPSATAALF